MDWDIGHIEPDHGLAESSRHLGDDVGAVVVQGRLNDGVGTLRRVAGLEDSGAYEHAIGTKLHHERSIGRSGDAPRGEEHNGQSTRVSDLLHEVVRGLEFLGRDVKLVLDRKSVV